jgi:hypothetical protein
MNEKRKWRTVDDIQSIKNDELKQSLSYVITLE